MARRSSAAVHVDRDEVPPPASERGGLARRPLPLPLPPEAERELPQPTDDGQAVIAILLIALLVLLGLLALVKVATSSPARAMPPELSGSTAARTAQAERIT